MPNLKEEHIEREGVWRMFDRIAPRYDLLNRVLSLRQDVAWRKRLRRHLPDREGLRVLDVATGTADVLLTLAGDRRVHSGVGVDPAWRMLELGRGKVKERGLAERLALVRGDGVRLPFADGAFDATTVAFGIRNVPDVPAALAELRRVLAPGGHALVLEFSLPRNALLRAGYLAYFRHALPRLGGAVSGDPAAYRYLNRTVESFPYGEAFAALMREAGFREVRIDPLTFGIATIYRGVA